MLLTLGILAAVATPQQAAVDPTPQQPLPHASPDLRFELGLRVRAMEQAFEGADADQRAAALDKINDSVSLFFSLNLPEAARALDQAREMLGGFESVWRKEQPAKRDLEWAASLCVTPNVWALEPGEPVRITISQLYPVELPEQFILKFPADGTRREVTQLPFSYAFGNLPELPGPGWLGHANLFNGGVSVGNGLLGIGVDIEIIPEARKRARIAQALRSKRKDELPGWVYTTTRLHLEFLSALLKGDGIETRLPGEDLLLTTERLLAEDADALSKPGVLRDWVIHAYLKADEISDRSHPHQQWIALPREKGRDIARIFVPRELESERPPLLLALHGAGGSENMFMDGYGNGKIRRLVQQRGWILVSPRMQSGIQLASFTKQMVELLGADPDRVFLLGHSMGAAAILSAATSLQSELAPKGVLLLGGGRATSSASTLEALTKINVFLAPGELDFARSGAESLRDQLLRVDHPHLEYWLVPNTEHLTVVQAALERCFDWMQAQLDG
jgi:predicted esterase